MNSSNALASDSSLKNFILVVSFDIAMVRSSPSVQVFDSTELQVHRATPLEPQAVIGNPWATSALLNLAIPPYLRRLSFVF